MPEKFSALRASLRGMRKRLGLYGWLGLFTALLASPGLLVVTSSAFRPVQDDYHLIHAAFNRGPLEESVRFFFEESGFLTQVLVLNGIAQFVGKLGPSLGYVVFCVLYLLIAFSSLFISVGLLAPNYKIRQRAFIALTGLNAWLLGIVGFYGDEGLVDMYANFSWFSSSGRGIMAWILIPITLSLWKIKNHQSRPLVISGGIFGVLIGFWSTAEGMLVSALGAIASVLVYRERGSGVMKFLVISVSALAGTTMSLLAPGSRSRATMVGTSLGEAIEQLPRFGYFFLSSLAQNMSILASFVLVALGIFSYMSFASNPIIGKDSKSFIRESSAREILQFLIVLEVGFLLYAAATVAGSALSYYGKWHGYGFLPWLVTIFVAGAILLSSSRPFVRLDFRGTSSWVAISFWIACLVALFLRGVEFQHVASTREEIWNSGSPAPLGYLTDREQIWINEGWLALEGTEWNTGGTTNLSRELFTNNSE